MTKDQAKDNLVRVLLEWRDAGGSVYDVVDAIHLLAVLAAGGIVK